MATRKGTKAATPARVEVVESVGSTDQELVATQGLVGSLTTWVAGLLAFWKEALALEAGAQHAAMAAAELVAPMSEAGDVALQNIIKTWNGDKKRLLERWAICSSVHQLHRRLTAKRDVGANLYDTAINRANALHNAYVDQARREAEAARKKAEDAARAAAEKKRQEELDDLEAQALKAEAKSPDLSTREQQVVDGVLAGQSWREACTRAGYREPIGAAAKLSDSKKMLAALKAGREAQALREQAAAKKELPVDVGVVETFRPAIGRAFGAHDRTTWKADEERSDFEAFRDAAFEGKHGIPRDLFIVDVAKLNEHIRSMGYLAERWPGIRVKKTTRVV